MSIKIQKQNKLLVLLSKHYLWLADDYHVSLVVTIVRATRVCQQSTTGSVRLLTKCHWGIEKGSKRDNSMALRIWHSDSPEKYTHPQSFFVNEVTTNVVCTFGVMCGYNNVGVSLRCATPSPTCQSLDYFGLFFLNVVIFLIQVIAVI